MAQLAAHIDHASFIIQPPPGLRIARHGHIMVVQPQHFAIRQRGLPGKQHLRLALPGPVIQLQAQFVLARRQRHLHKGPRRPGRPVVGLIEHHLSIYGQRQAHRMDWS